MEGSLGLSVLDCVLSIMRKVPSVSKCGDTRDRRRLKAQVSTRVEGGVNGAVMVEIDNVRVGTDRGGVVDVIVENEFCEERAIEKWQVGVSGFCKFSAKESMIDGRIQDR